jgi:hypothetical protein
MRFAITPTRILMAAAGLAAAHISCARADMPIDSSTGLPTRASAPSVTPAISVTSPATEPTSPVAAASSAGPTPDPSITIIPIPNGGFDADLSSWTASNPRWVTWQSGYARLNISGSSKASSIAQVARVPDGSRVTLHFRYRSDVVEPGPCGLESRFDEVLSFPADQQWREVVLNYSGNAGQELTIGVTGSVNDQCSWVNVDDFYWTVPSGSATAAP